MDTLTCNSCQHEIVTAEERNEHYRSEWHRYNVKRAVAGLPPMTKVIFETKLVALKAKQGKDLQAKSSHKCLVCNKVFHTRAAYEQHCVSKTHQKKAAKKPASQVQKGGAGGQKAEGQAAPLVAIGEAIQPKAVAVAPTPVLGSNGEVVEDEFEYDETQVIPVKTCLFCNAAFPTVEQSLTHMLKAHGFFVPFAEYLTDLNGLLEYLGAKVGVGRVCLHCNGRGRLAFPTVRACQQHMESKSHCKLRFEEDEEDDEFTEYYKFPGQGEVEDDEGDEGDEHDEDDEDDAEMEEEEEEEEEKTPEDTMELRWCVYEVDASGALNKQAFVGSCITTMQVLANEQQKEKVLRRDGEKVIGSSLVFSMKEGKQPKKQSNVNAAVRLARDSEELVEGLAKVRLSVQVEGKGLPTKCVVGLWRHATNELVGHTPIVDREAVATDRQAETDKAKAAAAGKKAAAVAVAQAEATATAAAAQAADAVAATATEEEAEEAAAAAANAADLAEEAAYTAAEAEKLQEEWEAESSNTTSASSAARARRKAARVQFRTEFVLDHFQPTSEGKAKRTTASRRRHLAGLNDMNELIMSDGVLIGHRENNRAYRLNMRPTTHEDEIRAMVAAQQGTSLMGSTQTNAMRKAERRKKWNEKKWFDKGLEKANRINLSVSYRANSQKYYVDATRQGVA